MALREDGEAPVSPVSDTKSSEFYRTFIGQLCMYLTGPQLTAVGQTWKSLLCLLKAHRSNASVFLLYHMHTIVNDVLVESIDSKNTVQKYYGLSLLSTVLQEGAFGAASVLYATSPALLCAVLLCSNGLTSQIISKKIFDVLTKMIGAPELSLPVRYILYANRDSILRMIDYISSLAYAEQSGDTQKFELDRRRVLSRLSTLAPPSDEEAQAVRSE
ncbi:hypothetical protein STCU_03423 [Strigomonas culicis]|uniref:Uncharacterized protein n=1 Tax=Strigomonas culicis TaxID=28005 RepID=S9URH8_9TRYP|nr:hypothetical protein STCU_03423 [Strigomonas culicis]|eukprot:EPY31503.1 hypothetical protein STCU_03423 [Strigomonas culicis]